jgi:flavin-dependent dehydrogenase
MTSEWWDAVVIGAGPAGSLAACLLARTRARVLLVERQVFPRQKVCGGCLNAIAVASLDRAGLGDRVRALGARPIDALHLRCRSRAATLRLPPGVAVSRRALDAELAAAAVEAGAEIVQGTTAIVAAEDPASVDGGWRHVSLQPRTGRPVVAKARVVLVADGLAGTSLRDCPSMRSRPVRGARIGVGGLAPARSVAVTDGAIVMAVDRYGYVGAVEAEDGRVNVAAAFDAEFLRAQAGPADAICEVLARAGVRFDAASLATVGWAGTVPLTRSLARPAASRLLVLGDASGYVEPFTGEGMAWAFAAAESAVPVAGRAMASWGRDIERTWVLDSARRAASQQRWCRLLALLLRAPLAVAPAIALLNRRPGLARPVLAHFTPRAPAS